MKTILLIGCGKMGYAMLSRWTQYIDPKSIYVVQPSKASRDKAAELGVNCFASHEELPTLTNPLVIFAVKPQVLSEVLPNYKQFSSNATFVSVIAGAPEKVYKEILGNNIALVRVMPNTPSSIGQGLLGYWPNDSVSSDDISFVEKLLSYNGHTLAVSQEQQLDNITAISGSGSAYVFYFLEAMQQVALELGFNDEEAQNLAQYTILGAALLKQQTDYSASELRQQVTSPNGTTQKALEVLMNDTEGLLPLLRKTILAAADRSKELSAELLEKLTNK